jgi:CHAD domain-containing protein
MDAVHDMRVASRRLRETMRLLAPIYSSRDFRTWYRRVRRITRALGPVRDADVFIDDFSRMSPDLAEGGKRAIAFMVGYRTGHREHELQALNRVLGRLDLEGNRKSFRTMAHALDGGTDADRSLADFAYAAIAQRAAVVFGAQPDALEETNVLEQHALRIDYKHLRYAVEAFAPCYGDDFDGIHDTLTGFQDILGDIHDLHVFADLVAEPVRIAAAQRAGVSDTDLAEVTTLLATRSHARYEDFLRKTAAHAPEALLPALLLPLTRPAEAAGGSGPDGCDAALETSTPAPEAEG